MVRVHPLVLYLFIPTHECKDPSRQLFSLDLSRESLTMGAVFTIRRVSIDSDVPVL